MIVEVNNTFGERRLYFLSLEDESVQAEEKQLLNGEASSPTSLQFHYTWAKDFHVSPFSSRKGGYAIRVQDPCEEHEKRGSSKKCSVIDNTITLKASKGRPKLVARVWSVGNPIQPETMSSYDRFRFVLKWWWVGFVTCKSVVRLFVLLSAWFMNCEPF